MLKQKPNVYVETFQHCQFPDAKANISQRRQESETMVFHFYGHEHARLSLPGTLDKYISCEIMVEALKHFYIAKNVS